MTNDKTNRITKRILESDSFENVAHVCCDWEEFVFEVAEWGVDHIAQVDFDDLTENEIKILDKFIASLDALQRIHILAQSMLTLFLLNYENIYFTN